MSTESIKKAKQFGKTKGKIIRKVDELLAIEYLQKHNRDILKPDDFEIYNHKMFSLNDIKEWVTELTY